MLSAYYFDLILIEDYIQPAAVIPCHHDGADIVDTSHGSFRTNGRCLRIVHLQEPDAHTGFVLFFDHPHQNLFLCPGAEAGGVTLKDIQSIDYSWGEIDFECRPMRANIMVDCCEAPMAKSYDLDFEPDDIEVSDTVTIVWKIA